MAKTTEKLEGLSGKMVKLKIMKSNDKHEVDPVPVSINGHQWTIRRNEEVIVPVEVVEVLEHATETQFEHVLNADHSSTLIPRDVQSYPFSAYAA